MENAAGALGEADEEMEDKIGNMVIADPGVKDIQEITVVKEGEVLHVHWKLRWIQR